MAVVGLGLIGGSLFLRLARAGATVRGYDNDASTREAARLATAGPDDGAARDHPGTRDGVAGRAHVTETLANAVTDADLVVLAVPLPAMGAVLDGVAATGYDGLLTDVTSAKGPVRTLALTRCPAATWVGGHPMAGREASGFDAADSSLLDGCAWVLCLEDDTDLGAWLRLAGWLTRLGARVVPATATAHDAAAARVSHVPHLVAAALAAAAGTGPGGPLALALGAGSFRDGTRVAATRADLVAAMCGGNADAVAAALDEVSADLARARQLLDTDDPVSALTAWLVPGHTTRTAWPPAAGEEHTFVPTREALRDLGRSGGWLTAVAPDDASSVTAVTVA